MPLYVMQDVKSKHVEDVFFSMDDAPEIGSVTKVAGRRMRRLATLPQVAAKRDIHFAALSLPRAQMTKKGWVSPSDQPNLYAAQQKFDRKGNPCFDSKRALDEFTAHSEGSYAYGVD